MVDASQRHPLGALRAPPRRVIPLLSVGDCLVDACAYPCRRPYGRGQRASVATERMSATTIPAAAAVATAHCPPPLPTPLRGRSPLPATAPAKRRKKHQHPRRTPPHVQPPSPCAPHAAAPRLPAPPPQHRRRHRAHLAQVVCNRAQARPIVLPAAHRHLIAGRRRRPLGQSHSLWKERIKRLPTQHSRRRSARFAG